MLKTRVIPCLLLKDGACVKTVQFKKTCYLGDPINIVKIFNEKQVDEIILLDITATPKGRAPDFELVERIVSQAFMPVTYGGGINNLADAKRLLSLGVEKIVVNTRAIEHPEFVTELAEELGAQSVVVSVDLKKRVFGGYEIRTRAGSFKIKQDVLSVIKKLETAGAGEIFLNMIDRDGMMQGYDIKVMEWIAKNTTVPVIACGGAGSLEHMAAVVKAAHVAAVAAGSFFVYYGKHRAVLISYPEKSALEKMI